MLNTREQIKIAVCGHVDHGKSTLIGRLLLDTGSLPDDKIKELKMIAKTFGEETQLAHLSDQLKEERERNITIETTQIFFKTKKRPYCLIDTPGHLEFIRNMLTGSSQADAALLLLDINEGIQDQTRRHAFLLKWLGLSNIIVVVNKMDLVEFSEDAFKKTQQELKDLFFDLKVSPLTIIPTSAKRGENISGPSKKMPWHKGPFLIKALDSLPVADAHKNKEMLLAIQDVYSIESEQIAVGRVASGTIEQSQKAILLPRGIEITVRSINIFGKKPRLASANESIGLTLAENIDLKRGDVISSTGSDHQPVKTFLGKIFWMSPKKLMLGQSVDLNCATQTFKCTITDIREAFDPAHLSAAVKETQELCQNQSAQIEFTVKAPAVVRVYTDVPELGRYTIESNNELSGAGTVLSYST